MKRELPELLALIEACCSVRSTGYVGLRGAEEFNAATRHVRDLVLDSITLLRNGSHARALFFAITALEELAKVKIGLHRLDGQDVPRRKDPLFNHATKHQIALDPVILIGDRLAKSIGADRVNEIFSCYMDGSYSVLREQSLYFSRGEDGLKLPSNEISVTSAAEYVLIAIEAFDDCFFCVTNAASAMCEQLNQMYSEVEERLRKSRCLSDKSSVDSRIE